MTIFDELAPVALELIDDLEVTVLLEERSVANNPTAGTSTITKTNRLAKAALKQFETTLDEGTRQLTTKGVVIVPASYLPNGAKPDWSLYLAATADATAEYKIVSAERVPKVGTAIVWRLKVQR